MNSERNEKTSLEPPEEPKCGEQTEKHLFQVDVASEVCSPDDMCEGGGEKSSEGCTMIGVIALFLNVYMCAVFEFLDENYKRRS